MKFFGLLFLVFFSFILLSCENTENSISTLDKSITNTSNLNSNQSIESLNISKSINGTNGGSIIFDTTYIGNNGKTVTVSLNLTFDPNSFTGTKLITVTPNPTLGSVQFSPEMSFNKPAKLNLLYRGIDLMSLGFDSNCKVDFVYLNDNGNVEFLLKDEVKIKFNKLEISTKKALLPHFSRYSFVRKSL